MVRCITCNVFHMRKFWTFFYCLAWSETVEFNRLPCPNNEMYGDAVFAIRLRYQLVSLKCVYWYGYLDSSMLIYCMRNRYWQNHRSIFPNFLLFAWFDTLEFNRLPWSNNKIYDDAVFADRFHYHLTILKCVYWYGYLDSLILILRMK